MVKSSKKVGIIGVGYVGNAVKYWFENKAKLGPELFLYDKNKNLGSVKEINCADIIFICVPTPYKNEGRIGYDDSAVKESLQNLKGGKVVVIKSTVLPGSTEKFQKEFPRHFILFNPEFLTTNNSVENFLKPDRQIVGYTKRSKIYAKKVIKLLPKAPFRKIMKASEAEMVKYFGNAFLATKVIFANQIYDLCEKLKIDYKTVKEVVGKDHRIGESHLDILKDGYRGYESLCLPKDVKSFIAFARNKEVSLKLLELVDSINDNLTHKHAL